MPFLSLKHDFLYFKTLFGPLHNCLCLICNSAGLWGVSVLYLMVSIISMACVFVFVMMGKYVNVHWDVMGVFHFGHLVSKYGLFEGPEQCLQSQLGSVVVSWFVTVDRQNITHVSYFTDPP